MLIRKELYVFQPTVFVTMYSRLVILTQILNINLLQNSYENVNDHKYSTFGSLAYFICEDRMCEAIEVQCFLKIIHTQAQHNRAN